MSIDSGLSDHEKPSGTARGSAAGDHDIGGYSVDDFCKRLGGISKRTAYNEIRAGRLKIAKVGSRSIVTRTFARDYLKMIEDEAEARAAEPEMSAA